MTNDLIWKNILEELKIAVSQAIFQTLFLKAKLLKLEDDIATIGCPSGYIQGLIEKRYYSLVKEALDRHTKKTNSLVFVIHTETLLDQETGPLFDNKNETAPVAKNHNLRADFTFENFAVSTANQLPFAAATAVAKNPGTAYNPLFIWGGVGVGKTHLMQAIGHEIAQTHPSIKIVFCNGEEFTNEIIDAIKAKATDSFKRKFRSAKVLLVDDIQFIAGKVTVQEEFFHTFNAITKEGGQVIMTSDRPPEEIARLEERLRSRFEAGLTVDIPTPDFELRTAILLIKCRQKKIDLPMETAQLIAATFDSNRRIEGFLTKVVSQSEASGVPISKELVGVLLNKNMSESSGTRMVKPKEVLEVVAEYFKLKPAQLKSETRVKEIVVPRQILMYLLRAEYKLPLVEVGRFLGGRDHTTIMHGVEKIKLLVEESESLRVDISGIKQRLAV